jgi:uncharacterized damage-inducible protein DinB
MSQPAVSTSDQARSAGDRALLAALSQQREHVLGILDGLTEAALRRRALPSGWTCLGLVRHLALDVERFWFRGVTAGESAGPPADAWQVPESEPASAVLDLYRREIRLADAVIEATPLDRPPARWPGQWPDWRLSDLREIILHVITETACHAGHLDAVRELIDGRTWMVLP